MVVANKEIDETKNAGESTTISMAMAMQRYDFTRSHWMPPSGKCLRRIAPAAAMVNEFVETTQTVPKHNF